MDARPWVRLAVVALGCGVRVEADTDTLAGIDAGFEGTNDGWVVTGGTLAAASTPPAPHGGVAAGRVTSTGTSVLVLSSQVWRVSTEPAEHTLTLWL